MALLYAQLAHAPSLDDACDALRLWATPLRALRGAGPPSRNNLSHASKIPDAGMAEELFWQVLDHLRKQFPAFGRGQSRGLAWRSRWAHSFSRLLTVLCAALWLPRDLTELLDRYGMAAVSGMSCAGIHCSLSARRPVRSGSTSAHGFPLPIPPV